MGGIPAADSRGVWIGAALGFAGIVLVLQPAGHPLDVGELLAFGGALILSFALIAVRGLGPTEPTVPGTRESTSVWRGGSNHSDVIPPADHDLRQQVSQNRHQNTVA